MDGEFGCSNPALPKRYGTFLSASADTQAKTTEVPNDDGAVVDIVIYDETTAISLVLLFAVGTMPPECGDAITVDGFSSVVLGVKHDWSNQALRQMTVTASNWKHLIAAAGE